MNAAVRFPTVVPKLAARARVDRPGMIRDREVKDAIDFERCRFDLCAEAATAARAGRS